MRLSDTESQDNNVVFVSCLYCFVLFYFIFLLYLNRKKCFVPKAVAKKAEVTLGVHNGGYWPD